MYFVKVERSQYSSVYSQYKYWELRKNTNLFGLRRKKSIEFNIFSIEY